MGYLDNCFESVGMRQKHLAVRCVYSMVSVGVHMFIIYRYFRRDKKQFIRKCNLLVDIDITVTALYNISERITSLLLSQHFIYLLHMILQRLRCSLYVLLHNNLLPWILLGQVIRWYLL